MTSGENGFGDSKKPEWWMKNEKYRQRFDLPKYKPPVFHNGIYVYEVVDELETKYDCTVQFQGKNTGYPDDIGVNINDEYAFSVGRHRNKNGNTIYELTSTEFYNQVERFLEKP